MKEKNYASMSPIAVAVGTQSSAQKNTKKLRPKQLMPYSKSKLMK